MQAVNLNDLRLLRVEHAPYELYKPGPKPCEFFIKTIDVKIVDQADRQVGNVRYRLINREGIVEYMGHFFAVLTDHSGELSDFAATLFDRRGQIRNRVRKSEGGWGDELNADATVAYLQEICVDKDFRGQGIGSWVLGQMLTHLDVYLDGAQFIYTLPGILNSEWPRSDPWASSDPYANEKDAMYNRIVGFYRRLGFRRLGPTAYFCCARSLTHPSRSVPLNDDADRLDPAVSSAGREPARAPAMASLASQHLT